MSCAVELRSVSVSYPEHVALSNVSLDVHRGDFVGVIGSNGAGKTTLLTVINGLGRVHRGTVRVLGIESGPASLPRIRSRVGFLPQDERIDPRSPVSCFEAVLMGRYGRIGLLHPVTGVDRRRAAEMMELSRTSHLRDRPVGHVSGGESRKVALARALAQEPEILLLDEPTTNLDPPSVRELVDLVVEAYRRFSLTVVMVTHHLDHLPDAAQKVVMMKSGTIHFSGPRSEALVPARIAELYQGVT